MGVYYYYVNETRREYFCIDPAGVDIKKYALGRNIGSRALSYLILVNDKDYTGLENHPLVGSWIGDRFFVVGDDYWPQFDSIRSTYTDIGQAIIEMFVTIEPYELLQYGGANWLLQLIEQNGDAVQISPEMRKRMSHVFREQNFLDSSEELERIVAALRIS